MARNIPLAAFVNRIRDDASRFQLDYMRAMARHPGLLVSEQGSDAWMRAFVAWLRAETPEKRADSIERTVKQRK